MNKMKSYASVECIDKSYDLSYVTLATSPLLADLMDKKQPLKVNLRVEHLLAFDWGVNRQLPYIDPVVYSKSIRSNKWSFIYSFWTLNKVILLLEACVELKYTNVSYFWDCVVDSFFDNHGMPYSAFKVQFENKNYTYYNSKDTLAVLYTLNQEGNLIYKR